MKCKVENCMFEASDLVKHIMFKHNLTAEEYQKKYDDNVIDVDLINKRQQIRKDKYTIKCSVCSEKFPSKLALNFHYLTSKDIEHNYSFYNDTNKDEWVECTECKLRMPTVIKHIIEHKLKISSYYGEIYSVNYKKQVEQRRKEKREKNYKFKCPINSCSCLPFKTQQALDRHLLTSKDIEHNHNYFNNSNADDWVECMLCKERRNVLVIHLKKDHNISVKEYKEKYKGKIFSKNYNQNQLKSFVNAGAHAPKERKKMYSCYVLGCEKKFSTEHLLKCHIRDVQDKEHSSLIYNESNKNEWVECQVDGCGYRNKRIDFHIKQKHKLSLKQYNEKYGIYLSKSFLEQTRIGGKKDHEPEKFQGKNNHFYGKTHSKKTKNQISKTLLNRVDRIKKKEVLLEQVERLSQDTNEDIDSAIESII